MHVETRDGRLRRFAAVCEYDLDICAWRTRHRFTSTLLSSSFQWHNQQQWYSLIFRFVQGWEVVEILVQSKMQKYTSAILCWIAHRRNLHSPWIKRTRDKQFIVLIFSSFI